MPLMSDSLLLLSYMWFFYSEDVNIISLVCGSELEPEDSLKIFFRRSNWSVVTLFDEEGDQVSETKLGDYVHYHSIVSMTLCSALFVCTLLIITALSTMYKISFFADVVVAFIKCGVASYYVWYILFLCRRRSRECFFSLPHWFLRIFYFRELYVTLNAT